MKIAKEFLIVPIIILIFAYLALNAYGFFFGNFARAVFPTNTTTIQLSKIYVTAVMGFVILEYFIISTLPNNYFFSRMLGMMFMMSLFIIINTFYNVRFVHHLLIIIAGGGISYATQLTREIRYQNFLALGILAMILTFIIVISF